MEARAKVEAMAREMGYSLAELGGAEVKTVPAPAPVKYRHPESPALTWSGRARNRREQKQVGRVMPNIQATANFRASLDTKSQSFFTRSGTV